MTSVDTRQVPLTRPSLGEAELAGVAAVLESGRVAQGRQVQRFEELVAAHVGVPHALAVTSATAGLYLALAALDIGPGDEVLVPAFTFPATGNVVRLLGARPVLVDVRLDDFGIDVDDAARKVGPRSRAVMPVDPFGLPYDVDGLAPLAEHHGLAVVEDAACALGAEHRGRAAGALGALGVFSFHGRKIITTGEGGMVVTADPSLAARLTRLRNHGAERVNNRMSFLEPASNHRLSDIAGAIGVAQMARLPGIIAGRRAHAEHLSSLLNALPGVAVQATPEGRTHTFQSYVVLLDPTIDRDEVIRRLAERGVESTVGTYALHAEPTFREFGYAPDDLPAARALGERSLTLPLFPDMEPDDVIHVAESLMAAVAA